MKHKKTNIKTGPITIEELRKIYPSSDYLNCPLPLEKGETVSEYIERLTRLVVGDSIFLFLLHAAAAAGDNRQKLLTDIEQAIKELHVASENLMNS